MKGVVFGEVHVPIIHGKIPLASLSLRVSAFFVNVAPFAGVKGLIRHDNQDADTRCSTRLDVSSSAIEQM